MRRMLDRGTLGNGVVMGTDGGVTDVGGMSSGTLGRFGWKDGTLLVGFFLWA